MDHDDTSDGPASARSLSFQALADNGYTIPPDTNGAVGPQHVMTMLNSQVRIQNKAGAVVVPDVSLLAFWAPTGAYDVFDPKLAYDPHSGRWLATCDANRWSASSSVLFAISSTEDPTGTWTFYRIDADPGDRGWADFPDLGFNATWIAITNNVFSNTTGEFLGAAMWVIVKDTALSGGSLTVVVFSPGFDHASGFWGHSLSPCMTFVSDPFSVIMLYIVDNSGWFEGAGGRPLIRLSRVTGNSPTSPIWEVVPGSGFFGSGIFVVDTRFAFDHIDAAQLGTSVRVETNNSRMLNAVYRNGAVWCTHTGGLPTQGIPPPVDRTAVFWYQLDPFGMPSPIMQSGVLDGGPDVHHFFPSITANAVGDACIGFSRSDPTRYVEAVYSGRRRSDPPGYMDPVTVLKAGEDSYEKTFGGYRVRWGDYSSTVVDPADDLTFWTLQEYAALDVGPEPYDDRWGTWWAARGVNVHIPCCVGDTCIGTMPEVQCVAEGGVWSKGGECEIDSDGDGVVDACDGCLDDPYKVEPGVCGCDVPDEDTDGDGTEDCIDGSPDDPYKIEPGVCGCDVSDEDTDGDGTEDCIDGCPDDPYKIEPGVCGCDVPDEDTDGDGTENCIDGCTDDPEKVTPGACGCGVPDNDTDGDTVPDCIDQCPGQDDRVDENQDGTPDCLEQGPVPTLSLWGAVILGLLLLVGAKIHFGRRRVETSSAPPGI